MNRFSLRPIKFSKTSGCGETSHGQGYFHQWINTNNSIASALIEKEDGTMCQAYVTDVQFLDSLLLELNNVKVLPFDKMSREDRIVYEISNRLATAKEPFLVTIANEAEGLQLSKRLDYLGILCLGVVNTDDMNQYKVIESIKRYDGHIVVLVEDGIEILPILKDMCIN